MDSTNVDPYDNFTPEEVKLTVLLWDMMRGHGVAPVVMFAINEFGAPCAMFNPKFSQADADSIGELIVSQLEVIRLDEPD